MTEFEDMGRLAKRPIVPEAPMTVAWRDLAWSLLFSGLPSDQVAKKDSFEPEALVPNPADLLPERTIAERKP